MRLALLTLALFSFVACDDQAADPHAGHGHSHAGGGHVHVAPHGGALVVLGNESLHVEFVLDDDGALTAYVLDGEAERAVRLAAESLELAVTLEDGTAFDVVLPAIASELTGETVGDTSEFRAREPRLAGVERFEGKLGAVEALGATFPPTPFPYPKGNE